MNSSKLFTVTLCLCLIATAQAAPTTDSPAGQESSQTTVAANSEPAAATPASSEAPSSSPAPSSQETSSASEPASDATISSDPTVTAATMNDPEMAAAAQGHISKTSFTCYNRSIGYYADVSRECQIYHFCLLGEYNGEPVYQRITYMCLKDTVFDQEALDCVEPPKMKNPCKNSESLYESSNLSLKSQIVGHKLTQ